MRHAPISPRRIGFSHSSTSSDCVDAKSREARYSYLNYNNQSGVTSYYFETPQSEESSCSKDELPIWEHYLSLDNVQPRKIKKNRNVEPSQRKAHMDDCRRNYSKLLSSLSLPSVYNQVDTGSATPETAQSPSSAGGSTIGMHEGREVSFFCTEESTVMESTVVNGAHCRFYGSANTLCEKTSFISDTAATANDARIARACLREILLVIDCFGEGCSSGRSSGDADDESISARECDELDIPANPCTAEMAVFEKALRPILRKSHSAPVIKATVPSSPKSVMKRIASANSTCKRSECDDIKRNVSFSKLKIREFTSVELSDNPSCSVGPPIQLGWEYRDRTDVDVDNYEQNRMPRRSLSQMVLPYHVRRYLLLHEGGYSCADITRAAREVEKMKNRVLSSKHETSYSVTSTSDVTNDDDDCFNHKRHPIQEVLQEIMGCIRSILTVRQ